MRIAFRPLFSKTGLEISARPWSAEDWGVNPPSPGAIRTGLLESARMIFIASSHCNVTIRAGYDIRGKKFRGRKLRMYAGRPNPHSWPQRLPKSATSLLPDETGPRTLRKAGEPWQHKQAFGFQCSIFSPEGFRGFAWLNIQCSVFRLCGRIVG
jgi:hypothetical protein